MRHAWIRLAVCPFAATQRRAAAGAVSGRGRRALFAALTLLAALPTVAQTSSALQWRRWEQAITSQKNYLAGGTGNPYRDLVLTVTYTDRATGKQFKRYGFWDGGTTFKIRAAFPPGTWDWSTSCTGTTAGLSCASGETATSATGPGLQRSGTVNVSGVIIADAPWSDLYNRGFLKPSAGGRYVTYGDGVTPFFWMADTAWVAPAAATPADWSSYVQDRFHKGFTTVLVAPATKLPWTNPHPFTPMSPASCTSNHPVPNDCSLWDPVYWQAFDDKIQTANLSGQVVLVAGLNDPLDMGTKLVPANYPYKADAVTFARNLAARLSGNFVLYSPAFDDSKDARDPNRPVSETQSQVMTAIATSLVPAQPVNAETRTRQLVTIHLAGGSDYADYNLFQSVVDLHVFHSGHGNNNCLAGEASQVCALRRAREMPLALGNYSAGSVFSAYRPNANGEALYEFNLTSTAEPDNPNRVRQAGHLTTLSGAFGYTLGVGHTISPAAGIFPWVNALTFLNSPAAGQMGVLRSLFFSRPWKDLRPQHCVPATATCGNLVMNQGAIGDTTMAVAVTTNWRFALAYLPNDPRIDLETSGFSSFTTRWSVVWWDPQSGNSFPPLTPPALKPGTTTVYQFQRPTCQGNAVLGGCDWVLILQDTCPTCVPLAAASALPATGGTLRVWQGWPSAKGLPSIYAQLQDAGGRSTGDIVSISTAPDSFHKLPQVARASEGSYLVVWQSLGLDGSLWGIFARRLSADGKPLGEPFQVNTYRDHDQTDPAVTASAAGFLVAWSSYGQDGDQGGIYARRVSAAGGLDGPEIQVNTTTVGHQGFPQIAAATNGDVILAWESTDPEGHGSEIYVQHLDRLGRRLGSEAKASTSPGDWNDLVSLEPDSQGNCTLHWQRRDGAGNEKGRYGRIFGADGRALDDERLEAPPLGRSSEH